MRIVKTDLIKKPENIKLVRHNYLSNSYGFLRLLLVPLDILPILASLYLVFLICLPLCSVAALEIHKILSLTGLADGIMPEKFYADLRSASIHSLPAAISCLPVVFLLQIRATVAMPPKNIIAFAWMILYVGIAFILFRDLSIQGSFISGTNSAADIPRPDSIYDSLLSFFGLQEPFVAGLGYMIVLVFFAVVFDSIAYIPLLLVFLIGWIIGVSRLRPNALRNIRLFGFRVKHYIVELVKQTSVMKLLQPLTLILLYSIVVQSDRFFKDTYSFSKDLANLVNQQFPDNVVETATLLNALVAFADLTVAALIISVFVFRILLRDWKWKRTSVNVIAGFSCYVGAVWFAVEERTYLGFISLGLSVCFIFAVPYLHCLQHWAGRFATISITAWYQAIHAFPVDANKILLLRPFSLDNTHLKTPRTLIDLILPVSIRSRTLEEVIAKAASQQATLLATGKPGESSQPIGANRLYLEDKRWKLFVKETISDAHRIVFIMGRSQFTRWEAKQLLFDSDYIRKLILVTHPDATLSVAYVDQNADLIAKFGDVEYIREKVATGRVRCLFRNGNLTEIITCSKARSNDYQLALDYAFLS